MKVPKAVEYIAVFLILLFASVPAKHAGAKKQGDVKSTERIPGELGFHTYSHSMKQLEYLIHFATLYIALTERYRLFSRFRIGCSETIDFQQWVASVTNSTN